MKILVVHSRYVHRGGEDEAREQEGALLQAHGHEIEEYVRDNASIANNSAWSLGPRLLWSQEDYRNIRARIRAQKSDLVVVHNFFPLISPSVHYAAHAENVPVVQMLHNYRMVCPSAFLLRDGRVCEDCVGKVLAVPGIVHACYRHSRLLSAGVAGMNSIHALAGTWDRVDRYIALTSFMRDKMVEGGMPRQKISVKPNFVRDPGIGTGGGGYFLFVGRLSEEKGAAVALEAWRQTRCQRELRIIGTGPEEIALRAQAASMQNVTFLGRMPKEEVLAQVAEATALILPSIWYEGTPITLIEAYSTGTPVIATNLGAMAYAVQDHVTGRLFPVNDSCALAGILDGWEDLPSMRAAARHAYEAAYTPERNYELMMEIYSATIQQYRKR